MMLHSFLKGGTRPGHKRPRWKTPARSPSLSLLGRRLRYECLEDRTLLAVVTSVGDAGPGTLREAIQSANANPGPDTIEFASDLAGSTITLTHGDLGITDDLTITGLGADQLTISGNNSSRIFRVDDYKATTITVEISGLSLVDGYGFLGGAVYNGEDLTVEDSTLANNRAVLGGGLANDGTVTVHNSTFANNSAAVYAGGIWNKDGTATVTNSTLADNSAHYGGGIYNSTYGTLTVTNSTLAHNSAHCGGGIRNYMFSTLKLTNSLVGGNTATLWAPDVENYLGTIDAAYNVIQDGAGSGIVDGVNGNQVGVDPLLDPAGLQDHGGPTQTIALQPDSPAIDAGSNAEAVGPDGQPLAYDQRGPGFPRIVAGTVDVGAFEVQNQSPIADDDQAITAEDCAVIINVLANDSDPDGDPLTVTEVADPASGSVEINDCGTITYTPDVDFNGVDSFMYTLSDGAGGTDTATVTITVLSAHAQIEALLASVQQLVDHGALNRGQGNALSVKLEHIQKKLDAGQTHVALNQLKAFTNQVADLIDDGVLTPEQGQPLLDAAEDLRTSLTVTADEAAVDLALADDGLLDGVLPGATFARKGGKKK